MQKIGGLSLVACVLMLSACGSSSSNGPTSVSVNDKGECTEQFIGDYNDVIRSLKSAAATNSTSPETIKPVKTNCDKFRAVHADGVSCIASDPDRSRYDTSNRITADSGKIYKACGMIDQLANRAAAHVPTLENADGDGAAHIPNCSQAFYNGAAKIVTAARNAGNAMTEQNIQKAKRACAPFKASYSKNYSCSTVEPASGSKTTTNAADFYFVCEKLAEAQN